MIHFKPVMSWLSEFRISHVEFSSGAVRTACDIQIDGRGEQ